jgi:hypothetical protein
VKPTTTSHAGGTSLINASHTSDMSTISMSHVEDKQPTTAIHAGGIDSVEKPRQIRHKPKLPCKLCKGDHLTHLFPGLPKARILWFLSASSSDYESSEVSSQSIQPLVDEVFMPMQYVVDTTLLFGSDAPLDHFV